MKDRIMMLVFVIVTGTILTTALVLVNGFTAPIIERNSDLRLKRNILAALGIPASAADADVEASFAENVQTSTKGERKFYSARNGDVAFEFRGSGLWGPINGTIALADGLETIRAITIFHQEETPGLGSRITEAAFLDTFRDKRFTPALKLVAAGKPADEYSIDAITGATMTCNAFIRIMNDSLGAATKALKGGAQ
jgi:Na+-transporting NADH:ubiquinone oxidoreductase subunit C